MKKLLILFTIIFYSCQTPVKNTQSEALEAGTTIKETIIAKKKSVAYNWSAFEMRREFIKTNLNEIIETLEIAESIPFTDKKGINRIVVLYRYSVGGYIFRGSEFLKKYNNKFYLDYHYISTYKNTKELEKLGERVDEWDNEDDRIDQYLN